MHHLVEGQFRTQLVTKRQADLQNAATSIAVQMGQASPEMKKQLEQELNYLAEQYNSRIQLIDHQYRITLDTYSVNHGKTVVSGPVFQGMKGRTYSNLDLEDHFLEIVLPVITPTSGEVQSVLVVSASTIDLYDLISNITKRFDLLIWVLAAVILFGAFAFSGLLVMPFRRETKTLRKIGDGHGLELGSTVYRELDEMNTEFSGIVDRLNQLDRSRQEFVSNVSHELKTPIASIRVLADSLLTMDNVPEEIYREFMEDISGEIDRETEIINDLLTMVKLDRSGVAINPEHLNMNELLENALKRLQPIATKANVELFFESHREVLIDADRVKLSLALNNLIENGIKYNNPGGSVRVILNGDHKYCYVKVVDTGIGIPEESVDHIFERFYRVDKARSRETGGTGLGLAITREVILLHNGAIKVSSEEGKGTTFIVRIPIYYQA